MSTPDGRTRMNDDAKQVVHAHATAHTQRHRAIHRQTTAVLAFDVSDGVRFESIQRNDEVGTSRDDVVRQLSHCIRVARFAARVVAVSRDLGAKK